MIFSLAQIYEYQWFELHIPIIRSGHEKHDQNKDKSEQFQIVQRVR